MDGAQVVSVQVNDPAPRAADPIPDRGRFRYREYWEGEIQVSHILSKILRLLR